MAEKDLDLPALYRHGSGPAVRVAEPSRELTKTLKNHENPLFLAMTKATPEILNYGIPKTSEVWPAFLNKFHKFELFYCK